MYAGAQNDGSVARSCGFRQTGLANLEHAKRREPPSCQVQVLRKTTSFIYVSHPAFQTATAMAAMAAKPLARRSTAFGVSDVIIGTSPLGGIGASISDAAAAAIVEKCVAAGFRDFDTAPLYGLGKAEERLGEGLRRSGKAAQCRVWTKVGRLIRTTENVPDPDDVEGGRTCRARGIYVDSPKDARPVQDYSWNGAFLSYDDSVRRLGENVKICGLRCHDPETKLLESLAVCTWWKSSRRGMPRQRQRHGTRGIHRLKRRGRRITIAAGRPERDAGSESGFGHARGAVALRTRRARRFQVLFGAFHRGARRRRLRVRSVGGRRSV